MKIKTNVYAGMTFEECDVQRDWWKQQAELMNKYYSGSSTTPPIGLWFPRSGQRHLRLASKAEFMPTVFGNQK